jgi:hypothetical protein
MLACYLMLLLLQPLLLEPLLQAAEPVGGLGTATHAGACIAWMQGGCANADRLLRHCCGYVHIHAQARCSKTRLLLLSNWRSQILRQLLKSVLQLHAELTGATSAHPANTQLPRDTRGNDFLATYCSALHCALWLQPQHRELHAA